MGDWVPNQIVKRYVSADPLPGHEAAFRLAWKHRHLAGWLHEKTPWWQGRKKKRRFDAMLRAIGRTHEHAQDRVVIYQAVA